MGEAKDIVGSTPPKKSSCVEDLPDTPHKARRSRKSSDIADRAYERSSGSGVLKDLAVMTDKLDRAIEVKMVDLDNEPTQIAENHVKLGLLRGASALIRRAKAMLEDYGKDLGEDMDPDFDVEKES